MTVSPRASSWAKLAAVPAAAGSAEAIAWLGAPLAAAHHRGRTVEAFVGRPNVASGQCMWLFGDVFAPVARGDAGGWRRPVTPDQVGALCSSLPAWTEAGLELVPAAPLSGPAPGAGGGAAADPENVLMGPGTGSLAWFVRAVPVPGTEVDAERARRSAEISRLDAGSAADVRLAERQRAVLDLIDDRAPFGLWRAFLAVGAASDAEALAGLFALAAMARAAGSPVRIAPGVEGWIGHDELATVLRAPARELPGLRVLERPGWDGVQEGPTDGATRQFRIGSLVAPDDTSTTAPALVPERTLARHAFVTGATGSGKSETVRTLLAQLAEHDIPWLVIEPAKTEYHQLADVIAPRPVTVLRPGSPAFPAAGLNPLQPTVVRVGGRRVTFPLQTHIDLVRALFEAAFAAEEPFPQILAASLDRCYRSLGWDVVTGRPRHAGRAAWPTLELLRAQALHVVDSAGYGREVKDNVRGFVDVRIGSLVHGAPGRFFSRAHELDLQQLAETHAVLQIEDVGNDRDQGFLMGAVLIRWVEMLRLLGPRDDLAHVVVVEEAHRLLRNAAEGPSAHAVEMIANLLAEVRAYGQGLLIAEQIPSKIVADVVKNSAVKVVHRLPSADDRDVVGATMNLDPAQSRSIVSFAPGMAAMHADGMDRPVRVRVTRCLAASSAAPAPARQETPGLVVRVSSCRTMCGDRPCSVTQLGEAAHVAEHHHLLYWVDLVVVAFVTNSELPSVRSALTGALRRNVADADRRTCGLAQAVERSVRSRWPDVAPYCDPRALSVAVVEAIVARVETGSWPEIDRPHRWFVRQFRWRDIQQVLEACDKAQAAPHGKTAVWQAERPDLELPDAPVAEQLAHVRERHEHERAPVDGIQFGEHGPLREPGFLAEPAAALQTIGVVEPWPWVRYVGSGP
jgi:hypothetical protein